MKAKSKGSRPSHTVWATSGVQAGTVGGAWQQADGGFHIKLNPFVVLNASMTIKMYPVDPAKPVPAQIEATMTDDEVVSLTNVPY